MFNLVFCLLGGLLILFIVLPLFTTILGTSFSSVLSSVNDFQVRDSILLTFSAGSISTLIALITGVPLAFLLARHNFPGKELILGIIDLPIVIPHTAAGIALLLVFGNRGFLGKLAGLIGIRFIDSVPGIVVGMLFVSLPFLVNSARDAFVQIDPEFELMAQLEGATQWQAFRYISLPLAARGILSGAVMMWARGISEFGAVVILAYNPQIVPVLVFEKFQGFGLSQAQPVAVILIAASLTVFILIRSIQKNGKGNI
ncbi:MAG: ABC transporter permease [Anaerolineales bacterium]|nr:ABC transporter permease [Anaerolineales bacterium]